MDEWDVNGRMTLSEQQHFPQQHPRNLDAARNCAHDAVSLTPASSRLFLFKDHLRCDVPLGHTCCKKKKSEASITSRRFKQNITMGAVQLVWLLLIRCHWASRRICGRYISVETSKECWEARNTGEAWNQRLQKKKKNSPWHKWHQLTIIHSIRINPYVQPFPVYHIYINMCRAHFALNLSFKRVLRLSHWASESFVVEFAFVWPRMIIQPYNITQTTNTQNRLSFYPKRWIILPARLYQTWSQPARWTFDAALCLRIRTLTKESRFFSVVFSHKHHKWSDTLNEDAKARGARSPLQV